MIAQPQAVEAIVSAGPVSTLREIGSAFRIGTESGWHFPKGPDGKWVALSEGPDGKWVALSEGPGRKVGGTFRRGPVALSEGSRQAGFKAVVSGHTHRHRVDDPTAMESVTQVVGGGPQSDRATLTWIRAEGNIAELTVEDLAGETLHQRSWTADA